MAFCRLVLPLLVLNVLQCFASTQVPVLILGSLGKTASKTYPLVKTTEEEFNSIIKEKAKDDPYIVIFAEQTLSVEDLSRKNEEGESSYPFLQKNLPNSLYLTSVVNPLDVLNNLANSKKVNRIELTDNGLPLAEIEPEAGKFLFINFKDAHEGESRYEMLRRHNDFMQEMLTTLQSRYGKVMGIYTAHFPSWTIPITNSPSRVRRQATGNLTSTNNGLISSSNFLLYLKNWVLYVNGELVSLQPPTATTSLNQTELNATLNFGDYSVTLNFNSNGGYWLLNTATLAQSSNSLYEELHVTSDVYAILGFSYRCGQGITFKTVNETKNANLTLLDVKVQPFFDVTANTSDLRFGDAFDCVGFFTAPIWSGLFVVFIVLGITFYGIMMMMDIRTNDRFDDPKGKTITISATE